MKAFYLVNLFFLVLVSVGFWRASTPLPEPLRNQTCDDRDPYEHFVVFRWLVTSTFVPFALIPFKFMSMSEFGMIFITIFLTVGGCSMMFNLLSLNRGDCINPEEKPLFLVWEYLPFDSIIVFSLLILLITCASVLFLHGLGYLLYMWIKIWTEECKSSVTVEPTIPDPPTYSVELDERVIVPPTYSVELDERVIVPPPYPNLSSKETVV